MATSSKVLPPTGELAVMPKIQQQSAVLKYMSVHSLKVRVAASRKMEVI